MYIIVAVLFGTVCVFALGSILGVVVAATFYGARLLRGAVFGGSGCVLVMGLANLGSRAEAPSNGFLNQNFAWALLITGVLGGLLAGLGRKSHEKK